MGDERKKKGGFVGGGLGVEVALTCCWREERGRKRGALLAIRWGSQASWNLFFFPVQLAFLVFPPSLIHPVMRYECEVPPHSPVGW